MHVRSFSGRKADGRLPSCCQLCPKSALWAAHVEVPSLTMAVQSVGLAQVTLETAERVLRRGRRRPGRAGVARRHDDAAPRQRRPVGADRHALGRRRAGDPAQLRRAPARDLLCLPGRRRRWWWRRSPWRRSRGAGLGPATPTAQQRRAVAQDTAPSSPVPLGAGWPTASGVPLGSTEDARDLGRTRVSGQRTARRGDGHGSENQGQAATASPDTPVAKHGAWKHGRTTIAVGGAFPGAPFDTLAAVDWVDLLIIGLMLLAAVHGLRLGAIVQILTFGGFFLGFLLGTVVWVPLLSRGHGDVTRSVVVVSPGPADRLCARLRRPRPRHLEQRHGAPAPPGQRRRRPRASAWPWSPSCSPSGWWRR